MRTEYNLLSLNGGSSSIKFAVYRRSHTLSEVLRGAVEKIGSQSATLRFTRAGDSRKTNLPVEAADYGAATHCLIEWLERQPDFAKVSVVAHRIVHGMQHTETSEVSDALIRDLKQIRSLDPEHLPGQITLLERFRHRHPNLSQLVCFDTAFHASLPRMAKLIPLPRRYFDRGIQRYGFHGLSYAFLLEELRRMANAATVRGKLILAHLGNGASLAAVRDGKSMETSMGFTPTSGLPMGTRSGDLDPGIVCYLLQQEGLGISQFNHLVNHESGLLGLSGVSSDLEELHRLSATNPHAAEAIAFFCYQTRKWIGSFTAVLEGLDTLVFSGGIGEGSAEVRRTICAGLEFLGLELDPARNASHDAVISTDTSRVTVRVIPTNEEWMMAKLVDDLLHQRGKPRS